jgi:hypothetical protein
MLSDYLDKPKKKKRNDNEREPTVKAKPVRKYVRN